MQASKDGGGVQIDKEALARFIFGAVEKTIAVLENETVEPAGRTTHAADALIRDKGKEVAMATCELNRQLGPIQDLGNLSEYVKKRG